MQKCNEIRLALVHSIFHLLCDGKRVRCALSKASFRLTGDGYKKKRICKRNKINGLASKSIENLLSKSCAYKSFIRLSNYYRFRLLNVFQHVESAHNGFNRRVNMRTIIEELCFAVFERCKTNVLNWQWVVF